jgi:hypothetical protein
MKLTTHLQLQPRINMSGAIPLLPVYAFTECEMTTLYLSPFFAGYVFYILLQYEAHLSSYERSSVY